MRYPTIEDVVTAKELLAMANDRDARILAETLVKLMPLIDIGIMAVNWFHAYKDAGAETDEEIRVKRVQIRNSRQDSMVAMMRRYEGITPRADVDVSEWSASWRDQEHSVPEKSAPAADPEVQVPQIAGNTAP